MRKFTKEDWYGFAGACPMTDGRGPYTGLVEIGNKKYVLIVGGNYDSTENVISVMGDQDEDGFAEWHKVFSDSFAAPVFEIACQFETSNPSSFDVLTALGFTKVL